MAKTASSGTGIYEQAKEKSGRTFSHRNSADEVLLRRVQQQGNWGKTQSQYTNYRYLHQPSHGKTRTKNEASSDKVLCRKWILQFQYIKIY